ncbi:hypothetical protein AAHB52_05365 [Bacillus toyonensis]
MIQFLGFGSIILVAKFINPESMAQIRSLQTYLTLAVILGTFGLDTAILKFCAEREKTTKKRKSFLIPFGIVCYFLLYPFCYLICF